MPPAPPPTTLGFGDYCFRATCAVVRGGDGDNACPIARVTGYDRHPGVGKDAEYVCAAHVRATDGGMRCLPAEVVMLPRSRAACSGQMFWIVDGKSKRIV